MSGITMDSEWNHTNVWLKGDVMNTGGIAAKTSSTFIEKLMILHSRRPVASLGV